MSEANGPVPEPGSTALSLGEAELSALAARERLLIALDFDGTLAPLQDDPLLSRMSPAAASLLRSLAGLERTWIALVSGRSLESLGQVASPDERFLLVGSHGAENSVPELAVAGPDAAEQAAAAALAAQLELAVAGLSGVWVERKPLGAVLHTRTAEPFDAITALALVDAAVAAWEQEHGALTRRNGFDVAEFALRSAHKGEALQQLRSHLQADAVLYAGDDVTDEDAFASLGGTDLGIKVGLAGETAAGMRVAGTPELEELLQRLLELRRSAG